MKRFLAVAIAALMCTSLFAEGSLRSRLESDVRFLADDLLEGRGSPGRGLDIAALYLVSALRASGWEPGNGDSYLQRYKLMSFTPKNAKYEVTLAGSPLAQDEFILFPYNLDPAKPLRAPLTFVGWGLDDHLKNIDDFRSVNVRDKAVVALEGAPWKLDPATGPFGPDKVVGKNIAVASRNGALLIHVINALSPVKEGDPPNPEAVLIRDFASAESAFLRDFPDRTTSGVGPIVAISPEVFDRTLGKATGRTYAEWQKALGARKRPSMPQLKGDSVVEVRIDAPVASGEAANVVGVLRGSDPTLRDEWVVLTAHYDHVGLVPAPEGKDGILNGADDNASGTAALLEVVRRLGAASPPRRSVMVLFVSAEERGLIGSAYYSRNPLVPFSRVVADINVDMVGRSDGSVQAITANSEEMFERAAALGRQRNIVVKPDQQPSWKLAYLTDSYHFSRFDVPTIEFFTGIHPDYHMPSDEADKVNFAEMERIVEIIDALVNDLVRSDGKPAAKRPAWFLTPD